MRKPLCHPASSIPPWAGISGPRAVETFDMPVAMQLGTLPKQRSGHWSGCLAKALAKEALAAGIDLWASYGMSETEPLIAV